MELHIISIMTSNHVKYTDLKFPMENYKQHHIITKNRGYSEHQQQTTEVRVEGLNED